MDGLVLRLTIVWLSGTEMFASTSIIALSVVLLIYWFRYSCILLLRNHTIAPDYRFSFGALEEGLKKECPLDSLERSLHRDYEVLSYLIQHTTNFGIESLEYRLLVLDYKVMQWWYRLTRTAAPEQARQAILEMGTVLSFLVRKIGERSGVQHEA